MPRSIRSLPKPVRSDSSLPISPLDPDNNGVETDAINQADDYHMWLDDTIFDQWGLTGGVVELTGTSSAGYSSSLHIVEKFVHPDNKEQVAVSLWSSRRGRRSQYGASAVRPFACTSCGRSYKRRDHLLRHERVDHSEAGKVPCPECGSLKRPDNMGVHVKKMHKDQGPSGQE